MHVKKMTLIGMEQQVVGLLLAMLQKITNSVIGSLISF